MYCTFLNLCWLVGLLYCKGFSSPYYPLALSTLEWLHSRLGVHSWSLPETTFDRAPCLVSTPVALPLCGKHSHHDGGERRKGGDKMVPSRQATSGYSRQCSQAAPWLKLPYPISQENHTRWQAQPPWGGGLFELMVRSQLPAKLLPAVSDLPSRPTCV